MRYLLLALLMMFNTANAALPNVSTGQIERLDNFSSEHVPARNIDIWLPPSYDGKQKHAVLYMHDGQMLYDADNTWNKQEWRVDEVAAELIAAGKTMPFIVVGIWNAGDNRHSEYFPQKPFESLSPAQQQQEYAKRRGETQLLFSQKVYSDAYLKFLVTELKPYIDSHYAVHSDREHTYVMGSSMGGLISMYALLEYPDIFEGAACLSTHWPGTLNDAENLIPNAFLSYMDKHLPMPAGHKIYFDYGTATLDALYPPLQAKVDRLIEEKGYSESLWQTLKFEGAEHSENAWAARLHKPLLFLLGK
ncbi:alpha/beta fold hydrolase [Aliiglaciecola sp. CAU 1673]|uniref:alpha/beta hydrolase n=1 Tax=Aliiglaciecola sp. CAU 1673 TaxID=3032595 RepID=UPI0023DA39B8|nr:alpha/beta fold hydrolase [Aliiglaciecola sp. CAU 1673]MDF2180289.1 alpha/beta fold hydrolase [Aliiglaciecola sp. CAU 1673]